jgi:hypothetical protein
VEVRKPHEWLVDAPMPGTAGTSSPEHALRRRPPLFDVCHRRRLPVPLGTLVGFAASSSSSGDKSRAKSRPGARNRPAPVRPLSSAAVSGESAAGLPLTDVPGRPSPDLWSRSHLAVGSTDIVPVNRSVRHSFAYKPLLFLKFAVRSSHRRETLTNRSFSLRFKP